MLTKCFKDLDWTEATAVLQHYSGKGLTKLCLKTSMAFTSDGFTDKRTDSWTDRENALFVPVGNCFIKPKRNISIYE